MDNVMPWYGTVLISFFSVGLGALFAWLGICLQLRRDKEKDHRQWTRQVRSEPLLAFRKQVANVATRCGKVPAIMKLLAFDAIDEMLPNSLPESERNAVKEYTLRYLDLDEKLQTALNNISTTWQKGEFQQAAYELDDKEIIDAAEKLIDLFNSLAKAINDMIVQRGSLPAAKDKNSVDRAQIEERSKEIDATILGIQRLINQRLQEL